MSECCLRFKINFDYGSIRFLNMNNLVINFNQYSPFNTIWHQTFMEKYYLESQGLFIFIFILFFLCTQLEQRIRSAGRLVSVWSDWPWSSTIFPTSDSSGARTRDSSRSSRVKRQTLRSSTRQVLFNSSSDNVLVIWVIWQVKVNLFDAEATFVQCTRMSRILKNV